VHTNAAQGITERVAQQMISMLLAEPTDGDGNGGGDRLTSTAGTPRARSKEAFDVSPDQSPPNTAPLSQTSPSPLVSGKYDASKPESMLGRSPLTGMLVDQANGHGTPLQTKSFSRSQPFPSAPPPATHLYQNDGRRPFQQPGAFHAYKEGGANNRAHNVGVSSAPFTRSQAMAGRTPSTVGRSAGMSVRDQPRKWQQSPPGASSALFR